MKKTPIILVGFGDIASGFSRVVHSLADNLPAKYEIHHLAVNVRGKIKGTYPWTMYPNDQKGDWLGVFKLRQLIEEVRPALVWFLNDFWYLARYYEVVREYKDILKTVAYLPLDGRIVNTDMLGALQFFDQVVVYNEFSKNELEEKFNMVKQLDPDFQAPPLEIIAHGIDRNLFYTLNPDKPGDNNCNKAIIREALYGRSCPYKNGFIVLNSNQNALRKCLNLTLEGFAKFARNKPADVMLHLHCKPGSEHPKDGEIDILKRAKELGIQHRLIHTKPPLSDAQLNQVYNACDVGINTSWAEGWGLISFEHAATGAAQIVPKHTACESLWEGAAEFLEANKVIRDTAHILEKRFTTVDEVAGALERLYVDQSHLRRMKREAYKRATQSRFLWKTIGKEWNKLFTRLLDNPVKDLGKVPTELYHKPPRG